MPSGQLPAAVESARANPFRRALAFPFALLASLALLGCGAGAFTSPAPPTPNIFVSISPSHANLFLGETQQFQATVIGASNATVTWGVNGIVGGTAAAGKISASGLYSAPAILPPSANVTISAVSQTNAEASASATATLKDDIVVRVTPSAPAVPAGGAQIFLVTVLATGAPSRSVRWSVNGIPGGNAIVGTVSSAGANSATYTAPLSVPSPATVAVTATSVADAAKSGSASVMIVCASTNSIAPASVALATGQTQLFVASLCVPGGEAIVWDVNGVAGGNATVGTIIPTSPNSALYAAPAILPGTDPVTIHATAGSAIASATITLTASVSVTVTPASATLGMSQRATFTATVADAPNAAVTWTVNGLLNGNSTVGEICLTGSNPCVTPAVAVTGSVDYLAPAVVPGANPVTLTATSVADPSKSGNALVRVTAAPGGVAVSVSPFYAFVAPSGLSPSQRQFFARVTGSSNTAVTWTAASAVPGQGCNGSACGSVDSNGIYTAPSAASSPNAISVVATSQADPTKSSSATVALTNGPAIEVILPSSVMAGAVEGFPLAVQGVNFVAGNGSSASTMLINGVVRDTICQSSATCSTALNPSDVQSAATLTVQIQNPGSPGALSNPVPFVIVPFDVSRQIVSPSTSESTATGLNFIVTEPTTAAASSPINVDSIGLLTNGNNCNMAGSPIEVTRPTSGTQPVSLCIHGTALDPSFSYAFTGPSGGDIAVAAKSVTGLFANTIGLDLQISSTTLPGLRTLVITTLNNDRAAATGMLEVQ